VELTEQDITNSLSNTVEAKISIINKVMEKVLKLSVFTSLTIKRIHKSMDINDG